MDLSLKEIFERARAAQEWVPPMEADLLYAAALRRAVELGVPLSPAKVMLREGGVLEMVLHNTGPEPEEYRAPEAAEGDPRRLDPRALVYAAGAVGYELFTGLPPPRPPHGPGPELTGPLGDVVRVAMSHDRRERFNDLQQLFDAVAVIEPHRSPPEERGLLAALLARVKRWEERAQNAAALAMLRHEHEKVEARLLAQESTLARLAAQPALSDKLAVLETALQAVRAETSAATARLQANLRELVEDRRREEARAREREEQRETHLLLHPPRPPLLPVIGAALLSGALASAATFFALARSHPEAPAALAAAPGAALRDSRDPDAAHPAAPGPAAQAVPAAVPTAPYNPASPPAGMVGTPTNSLSAPAPLAVMAPAPRSGDPLAAAPGGPAALVAQAVQSAAELSPKKRALALVDRGDGALEKGRPEAAVSSFLTALDLDPKLAEAHRGLGMAYALQGNDAAAKREYQRYLADAPGATDAADIRAAINELNQRSKLGD
jgi:tetratricopeptide (TPR) repeat protein